MYKLIVASHGAKQKGYLKPLDATKVHHFFQKSGIDEAPLVDLFKL